MVDYNTIMANLANVDTWVFHPRIVKVNVSVWKLLAVSSYIYSLLTVISWSKYETTLLCQVQWIREYTSGL